MDDAIAPIGQTQTNQVGQTHGHHHHHQAQQQAQAAPPPAPPPTDGSDLSGLLGESNGGADIGSLLSALGGQGQDPTQQGGSGDNSTIIAELEAALQAAQQGQTGQPGQTGQTGPLGLPLQPGQTPTV